MIDWQDANKLHDALDRMDAAYSERSNTAGESLVAVMAIARELRGSLPERFTSTPLNPRPGEKLCPLCRKHTSGGHERDSSDWCDGHEPA